VRPRQRLDDRVVFVADPTATLHFSRRLMPGIASRLYPGAEVYGMNSAPSGPATTEVILGALPGSERQGASLLHLSTHGLVRPELAVQTRDGTLPLARILARDRSRAPDAPGGLVITSACLTDVTLTDFDESLTLATALLAAGATAVIGTRWPVDDDVTTALAVRLHLHLKDGRGPAEALRRAQLDLLRPGPTVRESLGPQFAAIDDARLSHPASWAGHVHHGI
jgi:CHAT domain-containing protein